MSENEKQPEPPRASVKKGVTIAVNRSLADLIGPVAMLRDGLRLAADKGLTTDDPVFAAIVNDGMTTLTKALAAVDTAVQELAEAGVKAHEVAKAVHGGLPPAFAQALDDAVRQAKRTMAVQTAVGNNAAIASTKATMTPGGIALPVAS